MPSTPETKQTFQFPTPQLNNPYFPVQQDLFKHGLSERIDCVPIDSVTVSAPGWLIVTSSAGPGRAGLLDQLLAVCHVPLA
jgi:hypothetical protein